VRCCGIFNRNLEATTTATATPWARAQEQSINVAATPASHPLGIITAFKAALAETFTHLHSPKVVMPSALNGFELLLQLSVALLQGCLQLQHCLQQAGPHAPAPAAAVDSNR
jgi:hypothetical protein